MVQCCHGCLLCSFLGCRYTLPPVHDHRASGRLHVLRCTLLQPCLACMQGDHDALGSLGFQCIAIFGCQVVNIMQDIMQVLLTSGKDMRSSIVLGSKSLDCMLSVLEVLLGEHGSGVLAAGECRCNILAQTSKLYKPLWLVWVVLYWCGLWCILR